MLREGHSSLFLYRVTLTQLGLARVGFSATALNLRQCNPLWAQRLASLNLAAQTIANGDRTNARAHLQARKVGHAVRNRKD
jgi:hypothetical protein